MSKANVDEFKVKLKELMLKYGITSMGGEYDGDTHGIDAERFTIEDDDRNTYVITNFYSCIDVGDL